MNDHELLALAAKAAGYKFDSTSPFEIAQEHKAGTNWIEWNPLTDDGDAHRLTVLLGIEVIKSRRSRSIGRVVQAWYPPDGNHRRSATAHITVAINGDRYVATRRAIVCAAAAIGKEMP